MAERPVYEVKLNSELFVKRNVEFQYYSGFSLQQKRKCIQSLHRNYNANNNKMVLEISSKSPTELGVKLSAFNLMITTKSGNTFSVESAFQASKVFEHGGPYKDILLKSSKEAKKDERLKTSGKLKCFQIGGNTFALEPKTLFYNWLYVNTLYQNKDLAEKILRYDAFTDIEFNPKKSINCQAIAVAIYVGLVKSNNLEEALKSPEEFRKVVYGLDNIKKDYQQMNLFDFM